MTLVEVVLLALGGRLLAGTADRYRQMRAEWKAAQT